MKILKINSKNQFEAKWVNYYFFPFLTQFFLSYLQTQNREVSEWLKELAWKASIWVTVSRVRIPSSLLENQAAYFQNDNTQFYTQEGKVGCFFMENS
jgi:hypothetical protein